MPSISLGIHKIEFEMFEKMVVFLHVKTNGYVLSHIVMASFYLAWHNTVAA